MFVYAVSNPGPIGRALCAAATALNVHFHYAAARYEAIRLRRWVGWSSLVIGDLYGRAG